MKKLLLLTFFGLIYFFASAQSKTEINGAAQIRFNEEFGIPDYVEYKPEGQWSASEFQEKVKNILHLKADDKLIEYQTDKDDIGYTHHRFEQYYKGIPVTVSMIIMHEKNGNCVSFNGEFFPGINLNTVPSISEKNALEIAKKYSGGTSFMWEKPEEEAFLKKIKDDPTATYFPKGELRICPINGQPKKGNFRLTYRFDIYCAAPVKRTEIYVDAQNGEVIFTNEILTNVNKTGTAKTGYAGIQKIGTDSVSKFKFVLRETTHGKGVETYDANKGSNADFIDSNNYWNNVNAAKDQFATDAHLGAEKTWEFYFYTVGRNSYDNKGTKLISNFHGNYSNAYWNGTTMSYGDGDGTTYGPFPSLDVAGHELTHGVTANSSKLIYSSESGALNESFSDIFGNTVERFTDPAGASWNIAERVTKNGKGFRSMQDPKIFSNPGCYGGTYWASTNDVHYNSGVQNHWYYILVEGDSGTNDLGKKYDVHGIGMNDAARIAYRNNAYYLTPSSDYSKAGIYAIQAAKDLFGVCSDQVVQTTNAWYACGVGSKYDSTKRPMSGIYTIGGTSPDFTTFTAAVSVLNKNGVFMPVVFSVIDGSYNEQIKINAVKGTSALNTVSFQSQSNDSSKVDLTFASSSSSTNDYTLMMDSSRYITFKKISISRTGTATYGNVIFLRGKASYNTFENNKISGVYAGNTGLTAANSLIQSNNSAVSFNTITGNLFKYGMNAVYLYGNASTPQDGNLIEENIMDSFGLAGVNTGYNNNLTIRKNIITGNPFSTSASYGYGIKNDYGNYATEISNNSILIAINGSSVTGININNFSNSGSGCLVTNNFISVTTGTTTSIGLASRLNTNVYCYFNSVLNTDTLASSTAFYQENTSGNSNIVANNIFENKANGYAIYSKSGNLNSCNYNNFFSTATNLGHYNGTDYNTLTGWQTGTGFDLKSINVNPNFISLTDLHSGNDTLNEAGLSIAKIFTDIDGESRSTKPDIGADEFVPTSSCLKGSYTIGGTTPDYATFNAAVTDITKKGICNAVTFLVRDDVYQEKIRITSIPGASSINTITFTSQNGDSSKVILTDTSSNISSYPNYTLLMDSASWIIFKKITISRTGTGIFANVIVLNPLSKNNSFYNNQMIGVQAISNNFSQSIYATNKTNTSDNLLKNNLIKYGSMAISFIGDSLTKTSNNNFENNIIDSFYATGIYLKFNTNSFIKNNTISQSPAGYSLGTGIGIYNHLNSVLVTKNRIHLPAGGNGLEVINHTNSVSAKGVYSNNFIAVKNKGIGINASQSGITEFLFNNVHMFGTDSFSYAFYGNSVNSKFSFYNNNLINSEKGYAFYSGQNVSGYYASDYNNIFTNGYRLAFWCNYHKRNLKEFQFSSGLDAHSVTVDPGYYSNDNLHVKNAVIDQAGISLSSVKDDVDGDLRTTTPDIGADEFVSHNLDAGIKDFYSPSGAICFGTKPVIIRLKNFGGQTLTAATIGWKINGTAYSNKTWSGTLNTKKTDTLTLGNYSFKAGAADTLSAWTITANGSTDSFPTNDTFKFVFYTGMVGKNAGKDTSTCSGNWAYIGYGGTVGNKYSWTSSPTGYTSTYSGNYVYPTSTTTYFLKETSSGCVGYDTVKVTVKAKPNAYTGSSKSICKGDSIVIGGIAVKGNTYSWTSSPTGFTSTKSNPSITPKVSTTYYLTEYNGGCSNSNSITITVNPAPSAKTCGNKSICDGTGVLLGGVYLSGHTYSWASNPSGFSAKSSNPKAFPTLTTTYYLTEKITATGCSKSDSAKITVYPMPKANVGTPVSLCVGVSIMLGDTPVSGNIYSWSSSPSGFSSTVSNPTVNPTVTTVYSLTETGAGGCNKTNSVTITVNKTPSINIGMGRAICFGDSVQIGDTATAGINYSWKSNPSGFSSTKSNPIAKPTNMPSVVYFLTVTYTISGCAKSDSITITVNKKPAASVGSSRKICGAANTQIGDSAVVGNSYLWVSSPVGFTSSISNPKVSPTTKTIYTLVEVDTLTKCSAKDSVSIEINANPFAGWYIPTISGGRHDFMAIDTKQSSYTWDFGDGSFGTGYKTSHTYTKDSSFIIKLTVTNAAGCKSTVDSNYTVFTGLLYTNSISNINILIFPNPFKEQVNIQYSLQKSAEVKIEITDIAGKLISTLAEGNQTNGTHQLQIDASQYHLNAGVYFVKFYADGELVTKQVVRVK
ncbi:MAG: M4 family metallopeptidase [Bacteroidetes bacterium]|nr:M4 family metallopeptidase [Bacteroidota bacterium]